MHTPAAEGVRRGFFRPRASLRGACGAFALICLQLAWIAAAAAETYSVDENGVTLDGASTGPLGDRAGYLVERGSPLDLAGAQRALRRGNFHLQQGTAAGFGIAAPPVWMHLQLVNPTGSPQAYHLLLGMPWLDTLDVSIVHQSRLQYRWRSGDARPAADHLVPGMGYAFPVQLMPGRSELFVRAHTAEAFILPVSLLSGEDFATDQLQYRYRYGAFYGFLLAFVFYNLMLYGGLRERSHVYYALYLSGFVLLSLIYTGHGLAWWWPGQTGFQHYGLFASMVLYACAGFLFAAHFLQLQEQAPGLRRWIERLSVLALAAMAVFIATELVHAAVYLAYGIFFILTFGIVLLGVYAYRSDRTVGHFFLPAVLCSMVGLLTSLLAALGLATVSRWTIGAVEMGLMLEAVLLCLALGSRMRRQRQDREEAEQLARTDSLTALLNRRAFIADAAALWSTAVCHGRPMSAMLLDIDHFKNINDRFGHDCGDRVLQRVAQLLSKSCREGDILARWGGEEFVLLLPETDLAQACAFGERIRSDIERCRLAVDFQDAALTVSLGVAQLQSETTLNELVGAADQRLYEAKRLGRNRIVPPVGARVVA